MPEKLVKDKYLGETAKIPCPGTCLGITDHTVMAAMDQEDGDIHMDWWTRHQVVMCQGCKTLSFRQVTGSTEDYEQVGDQEWISHERVQLYPARKTDSRGLGKDVERLPDEVARLYEETRTALVNAAPVLTGIGLRALVETVCKEKNAPGVKLFQKIDGLVTLGVLTKTDATVLHQIRAIGNDAAHEAKPHPDEQLSLALEVVEHLLKSVYVMPFKLAKFMKPKPTAV